MVILFLLLIDFSLEKNFWSRKEGNSKLKHGAAAVCKSRKKSKCDPSEDQEIQAIGGKDASIFLFHALGKIIYCKSKRTLPYSSLSVGEVCQLLVARLDKVRLRVTPNSHIIV